MGSSASRATKVFLRSDPVPLDQLGSAVRELPSGPSASELEYALLLPGVRVEAAVQVEPGAILLAPLGRCTSMHHELVREQKKRTIKKQ